MNFNEFEFKESIYRIDGPENRYKYAGLTLDTVDLIHSPTVTYLHGELAGSENGVHDLFADYIEGFKSGVYQSRSQLKGLFSNNRVVLFEDPGNIIHHPEIADALNLGRTNALWLNCGQKAFGISADTGSKTEAIRLADSMIPRFPSLDAKDFELSLFLEDYILYGPDNHISVARFNARLAEKENLVETVKSFTKRIK
jgi:hypothetical protein